MGFEGESRIMDWEARCAAGKQALEIDEVGDVASHGRCNVFGDTVF